MKLPNPALLSISLLAAITGCGESGPPPKARHLVLVTVDTLRRDRLGCYGGPNQPSPTIDRLAAEGTLFENAFTSRGLTLPSFTSYFTSKYPHQHGVLDNKKQIPDSEWTLAERLADAGFHNRAFNASGVLQPGRGNVEQGFEKYEKIFDEQALTARAVHYVKNFFGKDDRREFLWVHYMNPHKPYLPPAPYRDRFVDPAYRGDVSGAAEVLDRIYVEKTPLTEADRRHVFAIYDATIAYVDDCVKEITDALREAGHDADTLLVFATDHGEDLFSHNLYPYHANSLYQSTTALAMIFRQPGEVAVQRVPGLVENVDLMPTVLGWLGVPNNTAPSGQDGAMVGLDLGSVLAGSGTVKRDFTVAAVGHNIFGARTANWHYVSNPDGEKPTFPPVAGEYPIADEELYRLADDPDEQVNRAGENSEATKALKDAIETFKIRYVLDATNLPDYLTAEKLDDMVQLGYVSAADAARIKEQLKAMGSRKATAPSDAVDDEDTDSDEPR